MPIRILLIAAAFVLPIGVVSYLQVSDLNRATTRLVIERGGLVCFGHGFAVLRALSALEDAGDPRAAANVRSAFAGFASSRCPERTSMARISGTALQTPRSRYEAGLATDHVMRTISDATFLTFDASPATVDAATPMAYSLSDAVPLLAFLSSAADRIEVAKTRATAASRLGMLDYDLSDLVQKAPWAANVIDGPKRREAAAVAVYFRALAAWLRHPEAPRPNVVPLMRASVRGLNELFAASMLVANADTLKGLQNLEERRIRAVATAAISLALALTIVWFAARGVVRRHDREVARFGELALKEARFQAIFTGSPLAIAISDLNGVVFECNQAYRELVGSPLVQGGREPLFGASAETCAAQIATILGPLRAKAAHSAQVELVLRHGDGSAIHCQATATLVRTPGDAPEYCAVMLQDVTERNLREQRLRHAGTHDALTGIANRSYFIAQLERRLERARETARFALMFIDVDDFKSINDRLGHAAGDVCLVTIAQRLRSLVRTGDVVARYGGDEFAILFCDPESIENVTNIAARLRREFTTPIAFGDVELCVSSSIGIATDDPDGGDADAVIARADRAMYADKGRAVSRAVSMRPRSVPMPATESSALAST